MALPGLQKRASHTHKRTPRRPVNVVGVQHPGTGTGRYLSPPCQREASASPRALWRPCTCTRVCRVAFADKYCGSLFGERPVPPSRLHTGYGITIMYVYRERQHTRSIHVRRLPTGTQRCPCPCPTVAARSGSTQHNRASPTRAMCLADGHGLDGKVDTSESQTLARAPGPRGNKRHLRVACGDETRGPRSLLHHHKHYCLGRGDVHVKEEAEAR